MLSFLVKEKTEKIQISANNFDLNDLHRMNDCAHTAREISGLCSEVLNIFYDTIIVITFFFGEFGWKISVFSAILLLVINKLCKYLAKDPYEGMDGWEAYMKRTEKQRKLDKIIR